MTEHDPYTRRLEAITNLGWKNLLNVQAPYRWNIRRLKPGYVLDVGCGIGRNLLHLDCYGVGIDISASSVEVARSRGCTAYTIADFPDASEAQLHSFDTILFAHVLEHLTGEDAATLVDRYLPYLRIGGQVIVIVPQEAGFASDETHITFLDSPAVAAILGSCGLSETRSYSFPFPRSSGRLFRHNETVVIASTASGDDR